MVLNEDAIKNRRSNIEKSFNRIFLNWMGWKVFLPLVLIFILWPIIAWILEIPHSFGRAFAHGDLLIFSALILMEAATEGERDQEQSIRMEAVRLAAKIISIIFICGFVATKADILLREHNFSSAPSPHGHDIVINKMRAYSCLNWTVALVSVVSSILIFWFNVDREKKHEYSSLAG